MSTYTYTARSADDPEQVITFTLGDHHMLVDLGAPLERVEKALIRQEGEKEAKVRIGPMVKPVAVSVLERATRPLDIADIDASVRGEGLRVTAWVRVRGLRVAPIMFAMRRVDNLDAAQAFVDELKERKEAAMSNAKLPGPLDYWGGWMLIGVSMATALTVFLTRRFKRHAE